MFWIEVMVGLISFFTLNSYGIGYTKTALMSILSGGIVPLFLFPKVWQRCWTYAFCRDGLGAGHIYLGKYTAAEAFSFIGLQIIWVALLESE